MTPLDKPTRRLDFFEHAIVLLGVCMSGNPLFTMGSPVTEGMFVAASVIAAFLLLLRLRGRMFHDDFVVVAAVMGSLLLVQSAVFSFLPVVTIIGFSLRLFLAYALIRMTRDFGRVYVDIMTFVGVLSLLFYVPDTIGKLAGFHVRSLLTPIHVMSLQRYFHIGLHNFGAIEVETFRNSGFFWEPGAFAGFLLLAMVFLALRRECFTPRGYSARLGLLVVCLLTTLSTMGYIILPLVLMMDLWTKLRTAKTLTQQMVPYLVVLVLTGAVVWGFTNLTFMQGKMGRQLEKVVGQDEGWEMTRFGSLLFDLQYIKRHPLIGWGLNSYTRFQLHPGSTLAGKHGNGLSDFLTKFGGIGLTLFLVMVGRGMYNISGRNLGKTALIILVLLLVLQGETFLSAPLFLGMMFLRVQCEDQTAIPLLTPLRVRVT